ncbi:MULTISPECIES: hypothetical protein [unclassified Streptomyces]|uniref:hypothetical protein n=1 Tax=unclassified Streptomyces TaxID=2593676 RepID=UPI00226F879A|nr:MULTISPECIES: hypothetical protein [unclassified Streptomyces]MCY0923565.1 hypothetical protein [Streptomyces sp. H27-G5]MCY0962014.1 hypothetical protein [Streptomyces sp. H27-H5]
MRRYLYRCPVCLTTSPVAHGLDEVDDEAAAHRQAIHGGHFPDGESAGEIDRLGRWYAALGPLAALHSRIADNLADLGDPKGMGRPMGASALAAFAIAAAAAIVLGVLSAALSH